MGWIHHLEHMAQACRRDHPKRSAEFRTAAEKLRETLKQGK